MKLGTILLVVVVAAMLWCAYAWGYADGINDTLEVMLR